METDLGLELVFPDVNYAKDILLYRKEFLDRGENMAGTSGLRYAESVPEWIEELKEQLRGDVDGLVQASTFLCVRLSDRRIVGIVNIRHRLNDYLRAYGGHIGYSIRYSERGQGYGKAQLQLALAECKKIGLARVLITCDADNAASRSVILANGGLLHGETEEEGKIVQQYWVPVV